MERTRIGGGDDERFADGLAAADLDGDGLRELVVAAPGSGTVYAFRTFDSGTASSVADTSALAEPGAGTSVTNLGDWTGDGLDDVAVGGVSTADGVGRVWIFAGGATLTASIAMVQGDTAGDGLGDPVSGGDVDGDGLDDIATGSGECGHVAVIAGPLTGSVAYSDGAQLTRGGYVGYSLALPGDLDADGYGDVVVTGTEGLFIANGPVVADSALGATLITVGYGTSWAVAPGGDGDADGRSNWTAASHSDVDCWVFGDPGPGSWAPEDVGIRIAGSADEPCRGATGGIDADADGQADLAFASPGVDLGALDAGAAYLFYGPLTADVTLATDGNAAFVTSHAGAGISSVASAGDTDGDGLSDLLVGAWGDDTAGADAGWAWLWRGTRE